MARLEAVQEAELIEVRALRALNEMAPQMREEMWAGRVPDVPESVINMSRSRALLYQDPQSHVAETIERGVRSGNALPDASDELQARWQQVDGFVAHVELPRSLSDLAHPLLALAELATVNEHLEEKRKQLVAEARARGWSWAHIAEALRISRQSAWERYSTPDE